MKKLLSKLRQLLSSGNTVGGYHYYVYDSYYGCRTGPYTLTQYQQVKEDILKDPKNKNRFKFEDIKTRE